MLSVEFLSFLLKIEARWGKSKFTNFHFMEKLHYLKHKEYYKQARYRIYRVFHHYPHRKVTLNNRSKSAEHAIMEMSLDVIDLSQKRLVPFYFILYVFWFTAFNSLQTTNVL